MKILISGIGRSGTTTIFNVLGDALLSYDRNAETVYEPYLWDIREAYKTATVKDQPFDNNQLNTFGIYTHTHTPIFLDKPTGLHDLWLNQNFTGLRPGDHNRLVKVIRGAGRLEATIKTMPDVKVILVTRNPVDTINSGLGLFTFFGEEFHPSDRKRFLTEVNNKWSTGYTAEQFDQEYKWSALWWKYLTIASFDVARKYPENVFVLPYELYVKNKKQWMQKVMEFVGIPQSCLSEQLLDFGAGPLTSVSRLTREEVELLGDHCLLYGRELNEFYPAYVPNYKMFRGSLINKYNEKKFVPPLVKLGHSTSTAVNLRINHDLFLQRNNKKLQLNQQLQPLENIVKKEVKNWDDRSAAKLKPKKCISVIISCYNNELTIRPAIESVLRQNIEISEIIVADDGSTDSSRKIISELATKHENVIPSFREYNVGVSANRDRAIRSAKGELVTTLDGDDLFLPGKLTAEYKVLENSDFNGIAFSDILLVNTCSIRKIETGQLDKKSGKEALESICMRKTPVPRDMLFAKELYVVSGGFDLDLTKYEDWLLKMKLSVSGSFLPWLYSGHCGTVYDRRSPGLSKMTELDELVSQLIVLSRINLQFSEIDMQIIMVRLIESFSNREAIKLYFKNLLHIVSSENVEKKLLEFLASFKISMKEKPYLWRQ
jgi:glycosyltransferase involved in cell wall biosynthesis